MITSQVTKWLVAYVSLIFGIALFVLVLTMFPDFLNGYTFYPLVLYWDALKGQLACLIIPISIGGALVLLFALNIKGTTRPLIITALLAANIMACCARFTGLALNEKEQASIQFEDHIYNVIATEQYFGPGDARWITLYECDKHNFLCRIIFNKYVLSTKATLIPNPINHTITVQINDETVYVHPVK